MKLIDLSKQLKISSKKVLKAARVLNIDVTSDLSVVSEEDAQRIIEYFENSKKAGFIFRKKLPMFVAGLLLIGVVFFVILNSSDTSSEVEAQISSEEVLNVTDELAINEDIDEVQITDSKPTPPSFTDSDNSTTSTTVPVTTTSTTVPVTTTTTVPVTTTTTTVPVTTTTVPVTTTTTTVPVTTTSTTVPETCDDESFQPYTLYKATGEANTVMSCRNEQDALESGYVLTVNPNPPTPTTTTTVPPRAGYLATYDASGSRGISVDSSKNAYTTGSFSGTVDFGGGDVTSNAVSDIFVVKLDSDGNFQWVYTAGGSGNDRAVDIGTDSSGNSYITGNFSETVNFGGGDVTSAGNSDDIFVVKLDSDGNFQWVYTAGGTQDGTSSTTLKFDGGTGIDIDSSGNVYITGIFDTVVDFGGGNVSSSGKDIFVLKLDTDGNFQWVYNVLSSGNDDANSITTDPSGNTYTTGYFYNTADFGGGDVTSNGYNDIFVVKLDSDGNFQWVYTAGGTGVDELHAIAIDSSDNVLTTGYLSSTVNYGGGVRISAVTVTALVLKLDSFGSLVWVNAYGGQGAQEGLGIAVDSSDNIFTTGYFYNTVDFGDGDVTSTGNEDIYILKLNSSGSFQWIKTYGSTAASTSYYDVTNDITVDTDGNVYTVGATGENTDFGTGNIVGSSFDSFVLKLTSSGSIE
jgi:uncharacterized protein YegP (UPF0339 family)